MRRGADVTLQYYIDGIRMYNIVAGRTTEP